jgi:hypothetical protein
MLKRLKYLNKTQSFFSKADQFDISKTAQIIFFYQDAILQGI